MAELTAREKSYINRAIALRILELQDRMDSNPIDENQQQLDQWLEIETSVRKKLTGEFAK